jgi:hypothetical protein
MKRQQQVLYTKEVEANLKTYSYRSFRELSVRLKDLNQTVNVRCKKCKVDLILTVQTILEMKAPHNCAQHSEPVASPVDNVVDAEEDAFVFTIPAEDDSADGPITFIPLHVPNSAMQQYVENRAVN